MSTPTFYDLIERLTRTTGSYPVHRESAKGNIVREIRHTSGLLEQLRAAVFGGMEGTGGSSAFGSRPPLDSAAADLLNEIDEQAAQALAYVTHLPTPYGTTEHYVSLWAGQTREHTTITVSARATVDNPETRAGQHPPYRPVVYRERLELTAYQLAQKWVDRIEDFFNPPSAMEIPVPCPTCGERYAYRTRDGQHIRSCALNFIRDRQTGDIVEARCSACAETWAPDMFERLAVMIGGKTYEQVKAEWAEKEAAEVAKAARRRQKELAA